MPLSITRTTGDDNYVDPFVQGGGDGHVTNVKLDVSALDNTLVDANGYLKPGAILRADGTPISGAAQVALGVNRWPVKVANSNSGGDLAAAADFHIPVVTHGILSSAKTAANLGRALSANELAALAIAAAGANIIVR